MAACVRSCEGNLRGLREYSGTRCIAAVACTLGDGYKFEDGITSILNTISSDSYREVATNLLRAWGRFVASEIATNQTEDNLSSLVK
jgi:hypothetical protein